MAYSSVRGVADLFNVLFFLGGGDFFFWGGVAGVLDWISEREIL